MAIQTSAVLKSYFNTGDFPTEQNFIDLIDSTIGAGDFVPNSGATGPVNLNGQNLTNTGIVGVGTTNITTAKLNVVNTSNSLQGISVANTITSTSADYFSDEFQSTITSTSDHDIVGTYNRLNIYGTQNNTQAEDVQGISGVASSTRNYSTAGTILWFSAGRFAARNFSTGDITNMASIRVHASNESTGIVTNYYGFRCPDITIGATLNAAYSAAMNSGSGKYNFYASGTANNYLNGNLNIGTTSYGTNATNTLSLGNGVAPASSPSNGVQLYSDDVAGSACPHFRTEAGDVIKFFKGAALTTALTTATFTAPGVADYTWGAGSSGGYGWTTNDEFKTAASIIANLQIRVNSLEARLQALNLIA
jgi:hypothetical protein